jgi:plastocyanin
MIRLAGTVSGWNASGPVTNPTITVNQGDMVTIILSSTDTLHQFALDLDRDGAKFTGSCSTGDTCSASFSTTSPPPPVTINTSSLSGTYTYFCTIHSTMQGNFMVNTGSVGATPVPLDKIGLVAPYLIFAALVVALVSAVIYRSKSARRKKL